MFFVHQINFFNSINGIRTKSCSMIIILFYIKSYITCYYELVSHEYSRTELAKESTKGTIIINHNESDK